MPAFMAIYALVIISGAEQLLHMISKTQGLSSCGKTNQLACVTNHVAMSTTYFYYSENK